MTAEGVRARVVSMPSRDLFEQQDEAYRNSVLPPEVTARVAVEQGTVMGWDRYTGSAGTILGHAHLRFVGADQGPPDQVRLHAEKVLEAARAQIARAKTG